ncbi:MAG: hypothetical protein IKG86_06340 [Paludibacteraceae bacterium]|nr:hypothetical protein [Paludibacteraceae bacterium]
MTLADQVNTVERALGERMLRHAFTIMRSWVHELGLSFYMDRIQTIEDNYDQVFDYFLSADDPERDTLLNKLTGEAYRLSDEIYADLRLRRGLSPQMVGFNPENPQSVMQYFNACVHLQEEDFRWFRALINDPERRTLALLTIQSLSINLRECFNEHAFMLLIEAMSSEVDLVSEQAGSAVIFLLAHYDVRIDFFPEIEDAFVEAVGDGHEAYMAMIAHIEMCKPMAGETHRLTSVEAVDQLLKMMRTPGEEREMGNYIAIMPESEREYMRGIVQILPDTWVYDVLVGENEERQQHAEEAYLHIGHLEPMLDRLPEAERWLVQRLRSKEATAHDYINYGHCCLLRGDRMMAYESYVQARQMCESLREFYNIFRPDRGFLVDRGVPVEQVYMLEDQIVRAGT